jgi:aminoglycoside N3'-acetyltransferase
MPWVTQQDIRQGLLRLGLKGGDTVLVHSSLSSFGWVEGSASAVVEALLQVLKEGGTLIAPTFSYYLLDTRPVPVLCGHLLPTSRSLRLPRIPPGA